MSVIFLRSFYHIFPTRLRRNYQADHCSLDVSSRSSGNDCVCVVLGLKWSYIANKFICCITRNTISSTNIGHYVQIRKTFHPDSGND